MILTYCYRILPNSDQIAILDNWMELLRRHWNYALGQRLDWLNATRCQIDRCSLVSCPIGEIPDNVNFDTQRAALKETKLLFPAYKEIYSEVQQINLERLDTAWRKWLFPHKNDNRGGRPRFKKQGQLRSIGFSRINHPKAACFLEGETLRIRRLGSIPVIVHRPLLEGFTLKTATIVKKADGWYVSISLENNSVPEPISIDKVKSVIGIDVGLKNFLTTSSGETVPVQHHYRRAQAHLARQQRCLSKKQEGSNRYKKQQNKIARIHQRIARQRQNFHYKIAHWLTRLYDLIAVEDLKVKNLVRNSKLAKSIYDVAWSAFITILKAVAVKRGVHIVKVAPHGTTVDCSSCGTKVPKTLSIRTHECHKCGLVIDRDENAARNILERALNAVGLMVSVQGGLVDRQPKNCEASRTEQWIQLSLF